MSVTREAEVPLVGTENGPKIQEAVRVSIIFYLNDTSVVNPK